MSGFFDEIYYLKHKADQLAKTGVNDANGKPYTPDTLKAMLSSLGITPEDHYKAYGRAEKLNPNPYFNEAEYLAAKKAVLAESDPSWATKSVDELRVAIEAAGITPAEHYEKFGAFESNSKGVLINPSNAFDANAYFAAKLVELKTAGVAGAETMKVADVVAVFKDAGISPVTHYESFGATEAIANNIPLIQTVPSDQRVANDPARVENVPGNYNPPTIGAASPEAAPAPVTKPADVGAKVPETVSPPVVPPAKPLPTPADPGYVAPPANIVDTNTKPVVPPSSATGDNWAQVNPDGSADLIKPDGNPGGTLPPGSLNPADPSVPVPPAPTPDPNPGGGGGGGGPLFSGTVDANGALPVTSSAALDKNYTFTVDASGELTVTPHGSDSPASLFTAAGVKQLDLSGVKVPAANPVCVTTDLTAASDTFVKFTGTNGTDAKSGYDYIKVTTEQVTSGDSTTGSLYDGTTARIDAKGGNDVLRLTDALTKSGGYTFGTMAGIETIIAEVSGSAFFSLDVSKVAGATSGMKFLLDGDIDGDTKHSGGDITLSGGNALTLVDLSVDSVTIGGKGNAIMSDGSKPNAAALELSNSDVTSVTLADGTGNLALTLNGNNSVKVKSGTGATLFNVDIFDSETRTFGDYTLADSVGTSTVDCSAQTILQNIDASHMSTGNLKIIGGAGNDSIFGSQSNDYIIGGVGANHLYGGHGADWLKGGAGDDIIRAAASSDDTDSITSTNQFAAEALGGVRDGVAWDTTTADNVAGAVGADDLWMTLAARTVIDKANILEGGAGSDEMNASEGKDVFLFQAAGAAPREKELSFNELSGAGGDKINNFTVGTDKLMIMDQDAWNNGATSAVTNGQRGFSTLWKFGALTGESGISSGTLTINGASGTHNKELKYGFGNSLYEDSSNMDFYIQSYGPNICIITIKSTVLAVGTGNEKLTFSLNDVDPSTLDTPQEIASLFNAAYYDGTTI